MRTSEFDAEGIPAMDWHLGGGGKPGWVEILLVDSFLRKPEIRSGLIGH